MSNGEPQVQLTADVGAQRVARVYAEALLNAATKANEAEPVIEEFASLVRDVFPAKPQVREFFASPAVPTKVKAAAIESTFGPRSSRLFTNFLQVLNEHERLGLLTDIALELRALYDKRNRRIRVQVRTAESLSDEQRDRLRQQLRESFHLEPILQERIDPDLLGGLVVRVGDWQFDSSIQTQLRNIRTFLSERSSHEIQSGRDRFSTGA